LARFNFTADDVARTRFSPAAAPVVETLLVMAELRGQAAGSRRRVDRWLPEARAAFPDTARPLLDLLRPCMPWPDFLDSFAPDLKEGLEEVRSTPRGVLRSQLGEDWSGRPGRPPTWIRNLAEGDRESVELMVRALRDLHRAVVEPRWDGALVAYQAEVARRIPVLAARGHEELFAALHPRLRWRENGLDRAGFDGEYDLHGLGMVLMPSPFWTGDPLFSISDDGLRPHVLIYAAQPRGFHGHPAASAAPGGLTPDPGAGDGLAALLGPTRAAVLRALAAPRGTAELAGVVGISPASASEHAKVLRDAYLIETSREGRAVRHSLTPLGATMIGQLTAADAWPSTLSDQRQRGQHRR
jgi:DNA-binding transcriptional ArsR family regulator